MFPRNIQRFASLFALTGCLFLSPLPAGAAGLESFLRSAEGLVVLEEIAWARALVQDESIDALASRLERAPRGTPEAELRARIERIQARVETLRAQSPGASVPPEDLRAIIKEPLTFIEAQPPAAQATFNSAAQDFLAKLPHRSTPTHAAFEKPIPSLQVSPEDYLKDLALRLWEANAAHAEFSGDFPFEFTRRAHPSRWKEFRDVTVREVELRSEHPFYPHFTARFGYELDGEPHTFDMEFRSNGHAAFLAQSWAISQKTLAGQEIDFAYRASSGQIETWDQSSFIIQTLSGDTITLSRVMDTGELAHWKSNQLDGIVSNPKPDGIPRTHFALNYFEYRNQWPFLIDVPKSLLVELSTRGELVVNTYEDALVSSMGIPDKGRTPFGLEVEIVALGKRARQALQPYMAKARRPNEL